APRPSALRDGCWCNTSGRPTPGSRGIVSSQVRRRPSPSLDVEPRNGGLHVRDRHRMARAAGPDLGEEGDVDRAPDVLAELFDARIDDGMALRVDFGERIVPDR